MRRPSLYRLRQVTSAGHGRPPAVEQDESFAEKGYGKRAGRPTVVVTMWDSGPSFSHRPVNLSSSRVTIEIASVVRIQQSAGGKSLFLHLHVPPTFETVAPPSTAEPTPRPQQVAGFDREHRRVGPFASKVLRIELRTHSDAAAFRARAELSGLPRIISLQVTTEPEPRFGLETMAALDPWLERLDIRIGFELEKLVRNGLVDGVKLFAPRDDVENLLRTRGQGKSERILAAFADSLSRLDDLEEQTKIAPVVVVEGSDEETNPAAAPSTASKPPRMGQKRKRAPSPDIVIDSSDDEADRHEALTALFEMNGQGATPRSPSELALPDLRALLRLAGMRSDAVADLYEDVDPTSMSRHVVITPTGFVLGVPSLEESNSVVRRFGRPDHFLRVTIRNEDGSLFRLTSDNLLESRFKVVFREGFMLAGRRWSFLAFASSALKASTCLFNSAFPHNGQIMTPDAIHRSLGEFAGTETARIPAKYMSRIGQAFSSSKPSIELEPSQIAYVADLVSTTGSLFSDGVGIISPFLPSKVVDALKLKLRRGQRPPTCFHVSRYASAGMLQVDPTLEGERIALRPSQVKFKSRSTSLEIAGTFEAGPAYLNRPLVKLLEDLGVGVDAFLRHQAAATKSIRKSRKKLASAIGLLEDWNLSPSLELSSTLSFLSRSAETSRAAFKNPFVQSCLDSAVVHTLREIKYKARILLVGCYNLVGVVDVSGALAEDEVYARVQTADGAIKLPKGVGLQIRNLINCVVFPAKGLRSFPSKLAGGDLDGDLYLVIVEEATLRDGSNFFFDYITQDRTSLVASRQLLLADLRPAGLFDPDCLKLAQLHSDCVDFVKSGTPVRDADIPRVPAALKQRGFPDFLSADDPHSYRSPKVLGQLFRQISLDEVEPPTCDSMALDPLRAMTAALASLDVAGLPHARLPPRPSRRLVDRFASLLVPFCSELGVIRDLSSPPAREEELFLHIVVRGDALDRSDKVLFSRRRERTAELFGPIKKETRGREGPADQVGRAWAAWWAAVETDDRYATDRGRKAAGTAVGGEEGGKFGTRSWGFLALSVLSESIAQLAKEQVEHIVIE
ncbi:hypothetical protein JCM10212_002563 [Sporobolomyces blumeae]